MPRLDLSAALFFSAIFSGIFFAAIPSQAHRDRHLYFGCEIYDIEDRRSPKLIRKFPGELCLFQKDGSVVLTDVDSVIKFSPSMKRLWSLSTKAHHQLNSSSDGQNILVIGSESIPVKSTDPKKRMEMARSDVLFVLSQEGQILKKFSLFDSRNQFRKSSWESAYSRKFHGVWRVKNFKDFDWEITHTNSFYEIDRNKAEKNRPEFKKGHYIVNDLSLMLAFVLDAKLEKIVWQKPLNSASKHMIHDVQVLPEGHLLFYDNGTSIAPRSRLFEVDLKNDKVVWSYEGRPDQKFFAPRLGGVQKLSSPAGYLYTDITVRPTVVEIDQNNKEIWSWHPGDNKYLQQARIADLSEFLKKNQAL